MSYVKVKINGGVKINYLHTKNKCDNDVEINQINAKGVHIPTWDNDTNFLVDFQNTIEATSIKISDGNLIGYRIQRYDYDSKKLYHIADTESLKIQDYNVPALKDAEYYIFPIIEREDETETKVRVTGSPLITDVIKPKYNGCSIVGLKDTDVNGHYIVDEDNIWLFEANTEIGDYTLNINKTFTDGFGRFPRKTQGEKKYLTLEVSSLVGNFDCTVSNFNSSVAKVEQWEDFCQSPCLKLYKDPMGRVIPVDIKGASSSYLFFGDNSPIKTSFSLVQMDDYKDISVYGTAVGL